MINRCYSNGGQCLAGGRLTPLQLQTMLLRRVEDKERRQENMKRRANMETAEKKKIFYSSDNTP